MRFVVLDEIVRLRLARTGKPEEHVDPLKDRGVAAMTDRLDVDLHLFKANAGVPRPALHQQHAAGGDAREKRLGRRDLLTRPAKVCRLVDHELVIAYLVDGAPGGGGAGGVHAVYDELVGGHRIPL
jgi:hypothetical protein